MAATCKLLVHTGAISLGTIWPGVPIKGGAMGGIAWGQLAAPLQLQTAGAGWMHLSKSSKPSGPQVHSAMHVLLQHE